MIPRAYTIPVGSLRKLGEQPDSYGGYADVWKGRYAPPIGPSINVAIKHIRVDIRQESSDSEKIIQVCLNIQWFCAYVDDMYLGVIILDDLPGGHIVAATRPTQEHYANDRL